MTDHELANALFDTWRRDRHGPNSAEIWLIVAKKARELLAAGPTTNGARDTTGLALYRLIDSHAERLDELECRQIAEAKSVLKLQTDFDAEKKKIDSGELAFDVEAKISDTLKDHRQWLLSLAERIQKLEHQMKHALDTDTHNLTVTMGEQRAFKIGLERVEGVLRNLSAAFDKT